MEGNDPGVLTIRDMIVRSIIIWLSNMTIIRWRIGSLMIASDCMLLPRDCMGSHVRNMKIDHTLMTALVKRWRHETHKCHIPVGEATITLEDITILLGLRIDGRSVTSHLTAQLTSHLLRVIRLNLGCLFTCPYRIKITVAPRTL